MVGEVGGSAGLELRGVGHGFAGVRVLVFVPAGLYVVVKAAEVAEGIGFEAAAIRVSCGGPVGARRVATG